MTIPEFVNLYRDFLCFKLDAELKKKDKKCEKNNLDLFVKWKCCETHNLLRRKHDYLKEVGGRLHSSKAGAKVLSPAWWREIGYPEFAK